VWIHWGSVVALWVLVVGVHMQLEQIQIGSRVRRYITNELGTCIGLNSRPESYYIRWDNDALNYGASGRQAGQWMEPETITLAEQLTN